MHRGLKGSTALTAAILLVVCLAIPALATVEKLGSTTCPGTQLSIKSYSIGETKIYVPRTNRIKTWSQSVWTHRQTPTATTGAQWKVTAATGLSNPGTVGHCAPPVE